MHTHTHACTCTCIPSYVRTFACKQSKALHRDVPEPWSLAIWEACAVTSEKIGCRGGRRFLLCSRGVSKTLHVVGKGAGTGKELQVLAMFLEQGLGCCRPPCGHRRAGASRVWRCRKLQAPTLRMLTRATEP